MNFFKHIDASIILFVNTYATGAKIIFVSGGDMFYKDKDKETLFGFDIKSLTKVIANDNVHELFIENVLFLKKSTRMKEYLNNFGICFVFHKGIMVSRSNTVLDYLRFLDILVTSYFREEKRCGYVSKEVKRISRTVDVFDKWKLVEYFGKERTCIGNELCTVIEGVRMGTRLSLRINKWIEIGNYFPFLQKRNKIEKINIHQACIIPFTQRTKFPLDGLKDILHFLRWISPTQSVVDIAKNHILSISLVVDVVIHLLNWGALKMIPKLTDSSVLISQMNKMDQTLKLSEQMAKFEQSFPTFPSLYKTLHLMRDPKTKKVHFYYFSVSFVIEKQVFEEAIIWLIEYEFLRQMETYIQFIVPDEDENDDSMNDIDGGGIIFDEEEPSKRTLSLHEMSYVRRYITKDKNKIKMLGKIIGYCNGDYSKSEIMTLVGLNEKEIDSVLEDFKKVLITYYI